MTFDDTDSATMQALLPESVQTLVAVIGYPATIRLIEALGGTTLHARTSERRSRTGGPYALLGDILTDSEVNSLMHHVGGAAFYIPRCDSVLRKVRNARFVADIAKAKATGSSCRKAMATLCPKYGFSDRYGWQLLRQYATASNVSSLAS
ncbi:Mor transcription activator family protein [Plesiomonas sp.]|uniref:Mor transcription activator family protein n=1 Tax=Plesiomonas sp. TaxID=2486279 RepID=UPI003F2A5210